MILCHFDVSSFTYIFIQRFYQTPQSEIYLGVDDFTLFLYDVNIRLLRTIFPLGNHQGELIAYAKN